MEAVLLVIHLIITLALIALVMIQPAEAGGFVGGGSAANMMKPRRSADLLTRVTTILAGCFFLSNLFLAILATNRPHQQSVLELVSDGAKPAAEQKAEGDEPPAAAEDKTDKTEPGTPKAPISK